MNPTQRHSARGRLAMALLVALGLCAIAADAAKPPMGRTYYTTAIGLASAYGLEQQCFEFFEDKLCSVDGAICGAWRTMETAGGDPGLAFDLTALVDGELMRLEGRGRLETAGSKSSLAGTGYFYPAAGGRGVNFSFAAREMDKLPCLTRLGEDDEQDGEVIEGSGNLATEVREVADFHSIAASGVGEIDIRIGSEASLSITADDNLLPLLTSEVRDGRLVLGSEGRFNTRNAPRYEITVQALDQLLLVGVFAVDATGIDAARFDVNISGVSTVRVEGNADHQSIVVAGVSRYDARNLSSRSATVDISGPSSAVMRVSDRLEGKLAGGATLEYIGNPVVDVTVDFTSNLRKIG